MAEVCRSLAEELKSILVCEDETTIVHLNSQESMHMTLFHASHPDERKPFSDQIRSQEITSLSKIAKNIAPFWIRIHSVTIAASGTLLVLFEGCNSKGNWDATTSAAFAVDIIRYS